MDIYSNKSFINVYLGYSLKQKFYKLVPCLYIQTKKYYNTKFTQNQKKYYKLVPWIFT